MILAQRRHEDTEDAALPDRRQIASGALGSKLGVGRRQISGALGLRGAAMGEEHRQDERTQLDDGANEKGALHLAWTMVRSDWTGRKGLGGLE